MKHVKKAPRRVFLVAFLATAGLLSSAAPGLAAETTPVPPLSASSPSNPAPAAGSTSPAAANPTDDTPGGGNDPAGDTPSGGWGGGEESGGSPDTGDYSGPDEHADPQPIADDGQPGKQAGKKPTARQTAAEKAAAKKASTRAKALQKMADRKAAAAKKSSGAKKKKQAAARKKAEQAAAKRMQQQAKKAAQEAARRSAAEKQREAARRSATADAGDQGSGQSGGSSIDDVRQAILDLTNKARRQAGCGTLRYSTQLEKSAQWMANDMSAKHYMSHTAKNGKDFDQRIRGTGFDGNKTGENLAEGFDSVDSVFTAWMHSPEHRRNILDCKFKILGVGFNSDGGYWAQHFGG